MKKELTIEEKYEAELIKAEHDHHQPTAGAMTGHILSNLFIERVKLMQAVLYAKHRENRATFKQLEEKEQVYFYTISEQLLDVGEVIPTTIDEFTKYAKFIEESAKFKYEEDELRIGNLIQDFMSQNLFITRAIKLATKEEKFALGQALVELLGFNQHTIRALASDLGKTLQDFKDEDEDDVL
ncbi:DNA-binding protein [Lactococcus allomyrinae]|uniref:DNA-binding protein n=1 Tax=Lactococcus allomyrinae TaxID=2419773 RepID=A0A387BCM7_9LACT|nr:DNA-binding protein [Lactococcus allomyrinae]AYF99761.1 DNA-binding protein [Lactococcus allomyrinae]